MHKLCYMLTYLFITCWHVAYLSHAMLQVMVALVLVQDYLVAKQELALSQATPLALVCNKH